MLSKGWRIGDLVWYAPSLGSPTFRAVVASEPVHVNDSSGEFRRSVVRLEELPPEYVAYSSVNRNSVPAAECVHHVFRRDPNDGRASAPWVEVSELPSCAPTCRRCLSMRERGTKRVA